MDWTERTPIVLTCGRGCAAALCAELEALGYPAREESPTAVETAGNLRDAMIMNLWSRVANRVLFEVAAYQIHSPDDLYAAVAGLPWENWLRADIPFHIHGVARHETIRDSRFAILRCKDAIADRFVEKTGRRPDSVSSPDAAAGIMLHWEGRVAKIYLDTSGVPLSHRGYRWRPWTAPLRETLAAALLVELGWGAREPAGALVSPMCGSGTLAIEAAWMAQRRAPGLERREFSFLCYNEVDTATWKELRLEAEDQFRAAPPVTIIASDIESGAIGSARDNAERARVKELIQFHTCDFRDTPLPAIPSLVVMNPGYGERVSEEEKLAPLYESIGNWLKAKCQGSRAGILTGNPELARRIQLHPARRVPIWNATIECRLLEYEMYAGTRDARLIRKHASD